MVFNKGTGQKARYSIGRKFIIYILLFSSLVTLITSSLQLYFDYSRDISSIEERLNDIQTSHLRSIVTNLWLYNEESVQVQLEGILALPDMQYLCIDIQDEQSISVGQHRNDRTISRSYPLVYNHKGKKITLGTMRVEASLTSIYQRLRDRIFVILATQSVKTFMVSMFIFFIFYYLVGRHLKVMAAYTAALNLKALDTPLKLDRPDLPPEKSDELQQLVNSINLMRRKLTTDISRQLKTEEILREKEEQVRLLLNSTAEAIFGLDRDGNCSFCNPSCIKLLGYGEESELIGKNMHQLIHHSKADNSEYPIEECRIYQVFHDEQVSHVDNEVLWRADGSSFWAEYWSHPILKDGTIIGVVVTFIDISARKAAEKEKKELSIQLQQAQKMEAIGTLAGGIAHDFNNLLTAILGYAELAMLDLPQKEQKARKDINEVIRAGTRAGELVKQILTFSRKADNKLQPLTVHLVVKEALKLLRASIPSTIELHEQIDNSCGSVLADPTQFHQIIMNLCTNAYHAMRETGGILAVELSRIEINSIDSKVQNLSMNPGHYIKLQVSDTGTGMSRATIDRIFEPYFTTKAKEEGTGMGLALIHGIVKNYGGHISVYSEPGQGTSFQVYLPRVTDTCQDPETSPETEIRAGDEHILLVDDEESIVALEKRILENLGYTVTATNSSREALEIFTARPEAFDLLITDMTMPHMTGAELSRKVLSITPRFPVIMCTGFSELISEDKAHAIGIREYIIKPVVTKEIARIIRKVLRQQN